MLELNILRDLLIWSLETNDEDWWLFTSHSEIPQIPQIVFLHNTQLTQIQREKAIWNSSLGVWTVACIAPRSLLLAKFIVHGNFSSFPPTAFVSSAHCS